MHLLNTLRRLVSGNVSTAEAVKFVVFTMAFGGAAAMAFAALAFLLTKGSLAATLVCGVIGLFAGANVVAELFSAGSRDS